MEFGFIKTKHKKKNMLQALSSNFINIVLLKKIVVELVKKKNLTNQYQRMDPLSGGWVNSINKT